jgi:tetratricopeptide (TPR) repeat protein
MQKKFIFLITAILLINVTNNSLSKENFFDEAKTKYKENKLKEAKFLFQRNIVFNPKDAKSYLFLAKIYHSEENQNEEEKNLTTTLLLQPTNEEATYMLINIELKKSNYSKVKELMKNFKSICKKLCKNLKKINDTLKNIEPENES